MIQKPFSLNSNLALLLTILLTLKAGFANHVDWWATGIQVRDSNPRRSINEPSEMRDQGQSKYNVGSYNVAGTNITVTTITAPNRKLVEWDDDELINELNNQQVQSNFRPMSSSASDQALEFDHSNHGEKEQPQFKSATDRNKFSDFYEIDSDSSKPRENNKKTSKRSNRLIYHGKIKRNETFRLVDGLRLRIDNHNPVSINRRSSRPLSTSSDHIQIMIGNNLLSSSEDLLNNNQETSEPLKSSFFGNSEKEDVNIADHDRENRGDSHKNRRKLEIAETQSASDWRPIVSPTSARGPIKKASSSKNGSMAKILSSSGQSEMNLAKTSLKQTKSGDKLDLIDVRKVSYRMDWKPITASTNSRSADKGEDGETLPDNGTRFATSSERRRKFLPARSKLNESLTRESVVYGKKGFDWRDFRRTNSPIGEPFDDDGVIMARDAIETASTSTQPSLMTYNVAEEYSRAIENSRNHNESRGADSSTTQSSPFDTLESGSLSGSRWMPIETTTSTTTTPAPTTTRAATALLPSAVISLTKTSTANTSESAQRSASDLNYIYSSQPVSLSSSSSSQSDNYYSNYLVPAVQQQSQTSMTSTGYEQNVVPPSGGGGAGIIDTTSGQQPEMIVDRTPEISVLPPMISTVSGSSDYSIPQSSSSFQPAQPPPYKNPQAPVYSSVYPTPPISNQARSPSYSYNQQQPIEQPARLLAPQPTLQPQVVRQEHHYHYYQPGQPQQDNRQQQQPERQAPQSNIIRELQPLLISQPIIQQQPASSTTTPAPAQQIIREIIKEVPVSTVQQVQMPTRLVVQQQPMVPYPVVVPQPTRLEQIDNSQLAIPAYPTVTASVASAPAQRIIRQISSSLPSVSIRMPANSVRLPFGSLQVPVRIAGTSAASGSLTRQTGSFVIPPMPKKTTTYLTETQAMPTHTTIMHTTQFTPATRTTVYTTDHQTPQTLSALIRK